GEVHNIKEMMKKSTGMGMITFDQALYDLYENGDISYQDAIKNADSAHDLRLDIQLRSRRAQNAGPDLELI
ncbi:type IV pili twitching motility protein PilT, partial [Neisseria sp. P0015.S010]